MDENIGSILSDVARLMRRSFNERARDIGLTRSQWQVLMVLRRNEGINQGGLADMLDVEPITLCRMVDRLQDAELVERRPDPQDRRAWRLFLTEKAQLMTESLRPLATAMFETALEGISMDERANLLAHLDRIRQNLTRRPVTPMVANG
jgi:DNA-binding MarR family transcriptional regulator